MATKLLTMGIRAQMEQKQGDQEDQDEHGGQFQ